MPKSGLQLPPLLLDRLQNGGGRQAPGSSSSRPFAMDSGKTVTQQRLETPGVLVSARQGLHSEWKQLVAARALRQRVQKKMREERDEEGDDDQAMDFTKVGENIAEHLKKQGVVFESQLDITYSIEALERIWLKFDDGIEEEDFVNLLSSVLATDPRKLSTLFQKMDANADGSIEWDEFLSYLLKEATHNWDRACEEGRAYLKHGLCSHDPVAPMRSVVFMPPANSRGSKYAALCDDRAVRIFDAKTLSVECQIPLREARGVVLSQIEPAVDIHNAEIAARERLDRHRDQFQTRLRLRHYRDRLVSRTAWDLLLPTNGPVVAPFSSRELVPTPTAVAYDARNAQVVVASSDKSITMYSASFDRRHRLQFHLDEGLYVRTASSCLDTGEGCVLLGDSHGSVSLLAGTAEQRRIRHHQAHGHQSVRKIMIVPNIGVASAGMDAEIVMSDLERWETVRRLTGHARGIYGLSQCPQNRLLVSIAYDARILLWDPYIATSTGSVHGHHNDVVDIVVNERRNQMMTATFDRKVHVYDIRMWRCIQTLIVASNQKSDHGLSAMTYDPVNEQLITAGSGLQTWQVVSAEGEPVKDSTQHRRAQHTLIVAVLHSPVFKQIISVSVDERVCLWDVFTGHRSFDFQAVHNAPITAACLDHRGKRLLTAAQNGTVRMWNFNNGAMMHEYSKRKREISAVLYLHKALFSTVGISASEGIIRWADPGAPSNTTPVFVHHEPDKEPTCIVSVGDLFATGDRNGELVIRYATSAIVKKRLQLPGADKVEAITKMKFLTINGVTFGFVGTDSGALHIVEARSWNIISSQAKAMSECITAMDGDQGACRLLVCDSAGLAKIWDVQALTVDNISTHMLLVASFSIAGPAESITATVFCPDIQAFVVGSDAGDIRLLTLEGMPIARFGQLEPWSIGCAEPGDFHTDAVPSTPPPPPVVPAPAKDTKAPISTFRLSNPKTLQPKGLRSESFFTVDETETKPLPIQAPISAVKPAVSLLEAALIEMKTLFCSTDVKPAPPGIGTPRIRRTISKHSLDGVVPSLRRQPSVAITPKSD